METLQMIWTRDGGWTQTMPTSANPDFQLVFVFGGAEQLKDGTPLADLRQAFPAARLVGCSTAGEIGGTEVRDESIIATAVRSTSSRFVTKVVKLADAGSTKSAAESLATAFAPDGLVHLFVLSDGLQVNGSELVKHLTDNLPTGVGLTGGLSGDGGRFEETWVVADGELMTGAVVAVGFYGDRLRVDYASMGGWDPFGPGRIITRSEANVLFELDGNSALELYKKYLGEYADDLPASGLLFPLTIWDDNKKETALVRTILAVDEAEQSLTFAGDVPVGWHARLMKANFERLIDGATDAAAVAAGNLDDGTAELAILISCVGRKMILKQRTEEEVEAVCERLGENPTTTGFYSYGEIAPFARGANCELHNQTMTVTVFREI